MLDLGQGRVSVGLQRVWRLATVALLLLWCVVVVLGFVAFDAGEHLRFSRVPDVGVLAALAAFVAIAACGRGPRWLLRWIASLCLGYVWWSYRVLSMGDGLGWRDAADAGWFGASDFLSSWLFALVARIGGVGALDCVPPVLGVLATYAWLHATDALLRAAGEPDAVRRMLAALMWVCSGVSGLFFHHYVENTQLGIGLLVVGLTCLQTSGLGDPSRREVQAGRVLAGAACLAGAALAHLQYVGMLAAALAAATVGVVACRGTGARVLLRSIAVVASVAFFVVLAVAFVGPFQISSGNVTGGPDNRLLVPLTGPDGDWFGVGALLSAEHVAIVAKALAIATPSLPVVAVFARPWSQRSSGGAPADAILLVCSLAYLAFASLYGFDLGWPADLDLMISMSPALSLFLFAALVTWWPRIATLTRLLVVAGLLGATLSTWSQLQAIVYHRSIVLAQKNLPVATLTVAGDVRGDGPLFVRARAGDEVTLRMGGTPGAAFFVLVGPQRQAIGGDPYGRGIADVKVPRAALAGMVCSGVFDERGAAEGSYRVAPLPDGSPPGLQMIVAQAADDGPRLSAAIYFELSR